MTDSKHPTLSRIDKLLTNITKVLAYIAAAFLIAIMLIAFVDAVMNKMLSLSIPHANEFITYAAVPVVFFGVAYTQMLGRHTQIEILTSKFHPVVRKIFFIIMNLMGLALCCFLTWRGYVYVLNTYNNGVISGTITGFKVWPFTAMMTVGWLTWGAAYLWTCVRVLAGVSASAPGPQPGEAEPQEGGGK